MITIEGSHTSMVKPLTPIHNVYKTLSGLILSELTARRTQDLASERVFRASQLLGVTDLAISSTRELPEKYEALCGQFSNLQNRAMNDGE
jgi:hypothetical protein